MAWVGWWRLVIFFSYDRPIVVGLLGLYLGSIAIALADWYLDIDTYVVPKGRDDYED